MASKGTKPWQVPALIAGAFAAIAIFESLRPLRKRVESRTTRFPRNAFMAASTQVVTAVLQEPLLSSSFGRGSSGVLGLLRIPRSLRPAAGVVLLDYTLWWWHWLNHEVPFFWRFHLVHHADRDLDASTAIRFHFGEMSLSVLYRILQLRLIGADRRTHQVWQNLLVVSTFFHHSNIALNERLEQFLVRLVVTPRMHGIHHSNYEDETDSNWSSLLSCWDWLHGTMRLDVPQDAITIGVPAYADPEDVTLPMMLATPFAAQREDWVGRDGVTRIHRA